MKYVKPLKAKILATAAKLPLFMILPTLAIIIFDLGWAQSLKLSKVVFGYYLFVLVLLCLSAVTVFVLADKDHRSTGHRNSDIFLILSTGFLLYNNLFQPGHFTLDGWASGYLSGEALAIVVLAFIAVREVTARNIIPIKLNPGLLFVLSFFTLILVGTGFLLLPNATNGKLKLIDAFFTSTSAVCVTGLAVKDTSTFFTPFGQLIILILIQLGGLGIMTLSSFISYFMKKSSTFSSMLTLREMTNSETIAGAFSTVKRIVVLTLLVEAAGAALIYFNLDVAKMPEMSDRIFFSAFHAISAFCNAGFSTASDGLHNPDLQFAYNLHLILAVLIIIGGFGFPVMINLMQTLKSSLVWKLTKIFSKNSPRKQRRRLSVNTRVAFVSSAILLAIGTFLFFILEYKHTLSNHSFFGKIVTAFFASVTTRTAGFNTVDMTAMVPASILLTIALMWIGASPSSTGGGIRTTTFSLAILRIWGTITGRKRVELYRREISEESFRKAFSVIFVSVIVIVTSSFLVSIFDPQADPIKVIFECFSAFGTAGLSLSLTPTLSGMSKLTLILTMFFGRVGMLTLLTAIFYRLRNSSYQYPSEDVLTN